MKKVYLCLVILVLLISIVSCEDNNESVNNEEKYNLTVKIQGEGEIKSSESNLLDGNTYQYNSGLLEINAIPADGWKFSEWIGEVSLSGNPKTTVLIDKDKIITAVFVEDNEEPEPDDYDFFDNFDGDSVDTSKWLVAGWVEHGGQTSRDRVYTEDGKLVMVFEYDTDYYNENGLYKSSAMQTRRDDFRYGRWEARLKAVETDGVLPTMYTIDWRDESIRTCQEIDIELVSTNIGDDYSEVHLALHGKDFKSWSTDIELPFNPAADYHIWGFDITEDRVQWFVDDIILYEYFYDDKTGVIDAPYTLKFNFWSNAGHWIQGPPVENTEIYYNIDWVRFTSYE
ncbi:MAG: family 16 glycosylhydrolase [Halanaerobiales bacterium]